MPIDLKNVIIEKEKKRYKYLLTAYGLFIQNSETWMRRRELTSQSGVNPKDVDEILDYLSAEGLLFQKTIGGEDGFIEITHRGIVEIEQSIKNPGHSTDHFQAPVVQQVTQHFHSIVGAVQTGNNNTANVNQNIGQGMAELITVLQQVRESVKQLPPAEQTEAGELIDLIEVEAKSENKNLTKDWKLNNSTEFWLAR
ncbi:MAG: hypothetical protein ABI977_36165 [Acidobacteriota bacterium]